MTYGSGHLPARQVAAALAGAGFEVSPFRRVERTLLDTFDGRLSGAGLRMEVRREAGGLHLTVTDGGPAPALASIDRLPTRADDLPAGPLRTRLTPVLDIRVLRPLLTVSSSSATAVGRNESGKAVVAVAIHGDLALASGTRLALPLTAEIVPYEGYAKAAQRAASVLASIGLDPVPPDPLTLAADEAGVDLRGFRGSPTVALDGSEPAMEGFRRVLANLAATIDANRQGTIDDVDAEFLHDLRIAVRRTRSLLSNAKGVLPAAGRKRFGAEFKWLGEATSPLRDADVYLIEWPSYVAPLDEEAAVALAPLLDHIRARREAEQATLAAKLTAARYEGLMATWRAWLDAPDAEEPAPANGQRRLSRVVSARIADAQAQLLARGRTILPSTPAEVLHELRKDAKRLRYLLECFGGLLPASHRKPFVQRMKALQDNLGEHQDTEVHSAQLQAMSHELHGAPGVTAGTLLAMGRLTELFEQRRLRAREEFAERFRAYDTKQTARVLDELLEAARP